MTAAHRASRSTTPWRVLAAALALLGAVCLVIGADRSTSTVAPATAASTASDTASSRASSRAPATQQPPRPAALAIPVIDVATRLTRLGLQDDGEVEVPSDAMLAGWYDLGPPPGAHGTAVILGHVDSASGPAVFARLDELVAGDRIRVRLDDGTSTTYVVRTVTTYANAEFPARRVYGGTGPRELNLVTCGGAYDATRGGYQSNVVVNARWASGART